MLKTARRTTRDVLNRSLGQHRALAIATSLDDARFFGEYVGSSKGRASIRRLRAMKNRYAGERCFIIGNGPSLKTMDLSPLRDEYTFGLNRIYLAFEEWGFPTTFLVATAEHVIGQFAEEIFDTSVTAFVSHKNSRHIKALPDSAISVLARRRPLFSDDPLFWGFWDGATVTYMAMQLANYLGFDEVVLIGVDHSFVTKGPAAKTVTSDGEDPNHFHPGYFGKGIKWQLPDLATSEVAYELARRGFEVRGKEIVDATVGGKLEIFRKVDFEDVIAGKARVHGTADGVDR